MATRVKYDDRVVETVWISPRMVLLLIRSISSSFAYLFLSFSSELGAITGLFFTKSSSRDIEID